MSVHPALFFFFTEADFSSGSQRNIEHALEILHGAVFSTPQLSGKVLATAGNNETAGC